MHEGTVLAFDFGTRRIGVAVGEMMLGSARPLTTISADGAEARFSAIGKLIAEWQPVRLVVGLPLSLGGEDTEMTSRCRRFARQLEGRFRLPVVLADERLSSTAADEHLRSLGRNWQHRKQVVDAEAAAIVLQSYFEEQIAENRHDPARARN
jgi:putative holliday junction resolvase